MAQAADYFLAAMDRFETARDRRRQRALQDRRLQMQEEQHGLWMEDSRFTLEGKRSQRESQELVQQDLELGRFGGTPATAPVVGQSQNQLAQYPHSVPIPQQSAPVPQPQPSSPARGQQMTPGAGEQFHPDTGLVPQAGPTALPELPAGFTNENEPNEGRGFNTGVAQDVADRITRFVPAINKMRQNTGIGTNAAFVPTENGDLIMGLTDPEQNGAAPLTVDPTDNSSPPLRILAADKEQILGNVQMLLHSAEGDEKAEQMLTEYNFGLTHDENGIVRFDVSGTPLMALFPNEYGPEFRGGEQGSTPAGIGRLPKDIGKFPFETTIAEENRPKFRAGQQGSTPADLSQPIEVSPDWGRKYQPAIAAPTPAATEASFTPPTAPAKQPRIDKQVTSDPARLTEVANDPNLTVTERDRSLDEKIRGNPAAVVTMTLADRGRRAALLLKAGYATAEQAINFAQTGFLNMNSMDLETKQLDNRTKRLDHLHKQHDYNMAITYDAPLNEASLAQSYAATMSSMAKAGEAGAKEAESRQKQQEKMFTDTAKGIDEVMAAVYPETAKNSKYVKGDREAAKAEFMKHFRVMAHNNKLGPMFLANTAAMPTVQNAFQIHAQLRRGEVTAGNPVAAAFAMALGGVTPNQSEAAWAEVAPFVKQSGVSEDRFLEKATELQAKTGGSMKGPELFQYLTAAVKEAAANPQGQAAQWLHTAWDGSTE